MLGVGSRDLARAGFEMTAAIGLAAAPTGTSTGYLGLPTLDSIGVRGQGSMTPNEQTIEVDSLESAQSWQQALLPFGGA